MRPGKRGLASVLVLQDVLKSILGIATWFEPLVDAALRALKANSRFCWVGPARSPRFSSNPPSGFRLYLMCSAFSLSVAVRPPRRPPGFDSLRSAPPAANREVTRAPPTRATASGTRSASSSPLCRGGLRRSRSSFLPFLFAGDETYQDIFRDFSHMASNNPEKLKRRSADIRF